MKKLLLFILLFSAYTSIGQTMTIINNTSCSFSYFVIGWNSSCVSDGTGFISLPGMSTQVYSSPSKVPWGTTPVPSGIQYGALQFVDCNGGGSGLVGNSPCTPYSSTFSGSSPSCGCPSYTITYYLDPVTGDVTVTIS